MGINVTKLFGTNVGKVQTSGFEANRYGTKFKNASYATSVPQYKNQFVVILFLMLIN